MVALPSATITLPAGAGVTVLLCSLAQPGGDEPAASQPVDGLPADGGTGAQ